jgi:DNA mismatch endonuclease (patch repair protein)
VPDVFTKKKRSEVMSLIKAGGNRDTELKLISIFRAGGVSGWRRRQALPGKPDFVFRRERVAVFVDGCFWHGCRRHCRMPKSRLDFWRPKIARNKQRDLAVNRILRRMGWRVLRVWEHDLRQPTRVVKRVESALASRVQNR